MRSEPTRRTLRTRVRQGRHALTASVVRSGSDVVVVVGGGEQPHVGCVAVGQPHASAADPARNSATTSLFAIPPHREGELASSLADGLARALGVVAVVAAGVHTDGLDAAGIETYRRLTARLLRTLLRRLR
jgi:gallate decarboxylase subunit D